MTELEVSSADTWFDTVTPDQYTRVQLEEATLVCSEHYAYRVHHFDNNDFDAVLLVNDTKLDDTTGPVTEDDDAHSNQDMSNTKPDTDNDDNADARGGVTFSRFRIQTMTSCVRCLVG
jgi:protein-tyrosine-phosphatase